MLAIERKVRREVGKRECKEESKRRKAQAGRDKDLLRLKRIKEEMGSGGKWVRVNRKEVGKRMMKKRYEEKIGRR